MREAIFLFLVLIVVVLEGLDYTFSNGFATFRLKNDDITIAGVRRNSKQVVKVKLSCGLNKLPVDNNQTGESSIEEIHNCVEADYRLAAMYYDSSWVPVSIVPPNDDVTVGIQYRYEACYEDSVDRCDSHLWFLRVDGAEIAIIEKGEKCESGTIVEDFGKVFCKRQSKKQSPHRIVDRNGVEYDGQEIKGSKAKKLTILGGNRESQLSQRRRKRSVANTCDYTLETTSTSTTTVSTSTTAPTSTVTSTESTTTELATTTELTSTATSTTTEASTSTTELTTSTTELTSTSTELTSTTSEATTSTTEVTSTTTEPTSTSTATSTTSEATSTSPVTSTELTSSTTLTTITSTEVTTTPTTTVEITTVTPLPDYAICSYLDETTTSTTVTTTITSTTTEPSTSTTEESTTTTELTSTSTETTSPSSTSTETSTTTMASTSTSPSTSSTSESTSVSTTEPTSTVTTSGTTSDTTSGSTSSASTSSAATSPTSTASTSAETTSISTTETSSTTTSEGTTSSTPTSSTATSSATSSETSSGTPTTSEAASTSTALPSTTSIASSTTSDLITATSSGSTSDASTSTSSSSTTSDGSSSSTSSVTTSEATSSKSSTTSDSSSSTTDPTSSSMSSSDTTSSSNSESTSTSTSDTSTTSSESGFDFHIDQLDSWEYTVGYSAPIAVVPTPNDTTLTAANQKISFECKTGTDESFVLFKQSSCVNSDGPGVSLYTFTKELKFEPTSNGFISTGTFDIRINMTNTLTGETASHILILHVIDATSTTSSDGSDSTTTSANGDSSSSTTSSDGSDSSTTSTGDLSTTSSEIASTSSSISDSSTTSSESSFDFHIDQLDSWEHTVGYSAPIAVVPTPNDTTLTAANQKISFECKTGTDESFVLFKQSSCVNSDGPGISLYTFTKELKFEPTSNGFISTGTFDIRINMTNTLTGETASHILILHVVDATSTMSSDGSDSTTTSANGDSSSSTTSSDGSDSSTTSTGDLSTTSSELASTSESPTSSSISLSLSTSSSDSSASSSTSSDADSSTSSKSLSSGDSATTSSSDEVTETPYDFVLQGVTNWTQTIHFSDASFEMIPIPNKDATKTVNYMCRNDTASDFLGIKTSYCLTEKIKNFPINFTTVISFVPVNDYIPSPGTYEYNITCTIEMTGESATHLFTLIVLSDASTTDSSEDSTSNGSASTSSSESDTSTSSGSSGSSGSGSSSTPATDAVTDTPYDFTLNGSTWHETILYSANTVAIDPVPNKDPTRKTISYTCRKDGSGDFVALAKSNCLTDKAKSLGGYTAVISWSPVSDNIPSIGVYEFNITVTRSGTDESASHIFTLTIIDGSSTTSGISDSDGGSTTIGIGGDGSTSSGADEAGVTSSATPTTLKSTRPKGVLSTAAPLSAAEQAAIDAQKAQVMDQLAGIIDGSASNNSLNSSSSLLNQISTMSPTDLVEVAQSLLSNTLKIPGVGNMSSVDVLTTLKDNIATTNSELAAEMNKVISQLAAVNMTSAQSMNSVLSSLDMALKGSTVYTLGVSSTKNADGTYSVIFGYVLTGTYTLVSPRCTLSIYGSTVYLTGDTRASYLQQTGDTVTATSFLKTGLGIQGSYTMNGRTVTVDQDEIKARAPLVSGASMSTMSGAGDVQSGEYGYNEMYVTAWNISYDNTTVGETAQKNTSMSFWLPASSAKLTLLIASGTMVKLQSTQSVVSQGFEVVTSYGGVSYTVKCENGTAKFIEIGTNSSIFSYDASSFTVTAADGSSTTTMKKMIQLPIVLENIDLNVFDNTASPLTFSGAGSSSLRIVFSPQDIVLPQVSAIAQSLSISTLSPTTSYSKADLQALIANQTVISVTGTLIFAKSSSIDVSGYTFTADTSAIYLENTLTTLVISSPTYSVVSLSLGGFGIQITAGSYTSGSQTHTTTMMEFSDTQKMRIDGGVIVRNGTNGWVIQNGKVSTEGDVSGTQIDIVPQSLMNQDSQQQIATILSNTQSYLEENGMTMTDSQINDTSNSLLSIASSLTSALQIALKNPLSSDLAANLAYATDNYDSLYNVLPTDPDDIVYVEEMTSDEWAAYVTKMMQKSIAKNLANQLASTLDTLENTLAARAIATGNLPYDYSNSADGTGMVIVIDDAANIVGKTQSCDEWDFTLPSPASSLNSPLISDSTLIQVGLVCYGTNPRTYVDNFDMLITSGALEAHLKDENQNLITITNTSTPIALSGRGSEEDAVLTLMQQGDFSSYQILDLHAFRTTNWNNSLQLQIVASADYDIPANDDTYMFSAFQSLPGPMASNHEWQFELNDLSNPMTYHVAAEHLVNNTGLFFMGIGKRNSTASANANDSNVVDYGMNGEKQWSFAKAVPMDYQITAISKGCYFYLNTSDMFNSDGMSPTDGEGMQFVNCTSNHLTMFSVGAFNPTVDADFQYNYNVNNIEKNVKVMITAIFLLIVYGSLTMISIISGRKDASRGRLRFLKDNEPHDGYMYVLSVETGYQMFATTDSSVSFNLSGSEGDQIFRSFNSEEDGDWEYPFSWGTTARFVMTTAFPLGQLEYLRIWIDNAGLDHRESWYCHRVIVKDLQTQEIFYFPFYNWLGTKNGDGETERLSRVDNRRRLMDESMSMHMLGQTIAWFAMFTGGGNRLRDRVGRIDYVASVILSLVLVSVISIIVLKNDGSIVTSSAKFSEFIITAKDIIIGVVYGIVVTILAMFHIMICAKSRSFSEQFYFNKRKDEDPNFKDPSGSWPYVIAGLTRACLPFPILLGIIYIAGDGMSLMDDFANAFYMRFLISLITWAVFFEPLKGVIWAFVLLKSSKSHKIVNKLEEAFLRVQPVETFKRNPYGKIEKDLGSDIVDITKLRDTDSRKMRDEQLFVTLRDMLVYFASLYIMVALTLYCRDTNAFYYQQEMSTILNLPQGSYGDSSFQSIRNADDFWTWARDSLATAMLASWYDGNPAYGMRAYLNDKVSRSMGIGTIRQVRTKKSAQCDMVKQFEGFINGCQEELTGKNEEKTLYMQTGWVPLDSDNSSDAADEYTYKSEKDLQTGTVSGYLGSYGGGGYTVSMSGTVAEMHTLFNKLEEERWIDEFTRAIIIEFSTYNAQINYFSVVQLLVEIPKSGIYMTNSWVEPVRLIKSEGEGGGAVKYYEMVYIGFSIFIFLKEVLFYLWGRYKVVRAMKKTWNPFRIVYQLVFGNFTPWNFMDLVVGVLGIASVIAYFLRQKHTNKAMEDFIENNGNSYINLTVQRNMDLAFNYCLAGAVFFTSCKMIRILRFNRRIGILAATLDNALVAIVSFCVAFLFFCMAFNSVLYALLGNKMSGYRSQISAFETSLAGMLGKLDVMSVKPISNFAYVWTMIYMIVGSKLVLPLYVTIIMYEFEEIRNDSEKQTNDYEIIDHIKHKTKRRLGLLEPKDFHPISIADTQKDFRLFHSAVARVNLLHYKATRLLQAKGQYQNETVINYTLSYDPVAAIEKKGPKRFEKWRLNDVEGM